MISQSVKKLQRNHLSSKMRDSFRFVHWRARCLKMSSRPFMLDKAFGSQPGHQSRESGSFMFKLLVYFIKTNKRLLILSRTLFTMQQRMHVDVALIFLSFTPQAIVAWFALLLICSSIFYCYYLLFVNILGCSFKKEKQRNVEITLIFPLNI